MKTGIHPKYFPNAVVICACGNTWTTGSTKAELHTDVCSACHPFFTGEQRIIDTAGQVDRFMKRLRGKEEIKAKVRAEAEVRQVEKEAVRKARARGDNPAKAAKKVRETAAPATDEA